MATPYNGFDLPVVGADADAWGGKLNTILTSIDTLLSSPANTIKGNNGGSQVATENLTPAEVQAMLPAVVGATQLLSGTKGAVPQPLLTQQNRVLGGDGTWRYGLGRSFGCVITTTNINGSQPTFTNGLNVASLSLLTVAGAQSFCTVTFTDALPNATYAVFAQPNSGSSTASGSSYSNKTTTSVIIYWDNTGGVNTEISVSGF